MQVKPHDLTEHLARKGLQSSYLVFGAEPLQALESADAIRAAARAGGIGERSIHDLVAEDLGALRNLTRNLSLFADRRLIEIRMSGKKLDKLAVECLVELVGDIGSSDVLLLIAEQLDRTQQAGAWFKACLEHGVVIACREPEPAAFREWLRTRAMRRGLTLSAEANEFLAVRAEGNLAAAAQEIDKLVLLAPTPMVDLAQTINAVSDSARYDAFQCVDAALEGAPARTVRIARGLREEGTEPIVIGWSLNRELRTLTRVAAAEACGTPLETAFSEQGVWSSRQNLVRRALRRHSVARLSMFLEASIRLDQLIKGRGTGTVWDELESLLLALAGGPWFGREVK